MISTMNSPPRFDKSEEEIEKVIKEATSRGLNIDASTEMPEVVISLSSWVKMATSDPKPTYERWVKCKDEMELPIPVEACNTASGSFAAISPTLLSYTASKSGVLRFDRKLLFHKIREIRRSIGPVATNSGELLRELSENDD